MGQKLDLRKRFIRQFSRTVSGVHDWWGWFRGLSLVPRSTPGYFPSALRAGSSLPVYHHGFRLWSMKVSWSFRSMINSHHRKRVALFRRLLTPLVALFLEDFEHGGRSVRSLHRRLKNQSRHQRRPRHHLRPPSATSQLTPKTRTPAPKTRSPAPKTRTPALKTRTPAPLTRTPAPLTRSLIPQARAPAPPNKSPTPQARSIRSQAKTPAAQPSRPAP